MSISRRDWLRIAAAAGAAPLVSSTLGCDDTDSTLDPDALSDGALVDAAADLGRDPDAAPDAGLDMAEADAELDSEPDAEGDVALDAAPDAEPDVQPDAMAPAVGAFQHGVASGDPLTDAVIIWTRVTPEGPDAPEAVDVDWRIATDPELADIVAEGTVTTSAERDFTVKVDVSGLDAGTRYYYGFSALDEDSVVGRALTAPDGSPDNLRYAVVSCAHFAEGYFHVYRRVADREDLDLVIHLGDYIYEGGGRKVRAFDPPRTIVTLAEYRQRHAQYKRDLDLQAAHQAHPFVAVWDDHETANNAHMNGAPNHNPGSQGDWETRREAGKQAYFEWMPIRESGDGSIFRTFSYGDLFDLIMLDTRLWGRDPPPMGQDLDAQRRDPERRLLGADQEAWLHDQLLTSTARWRFLGQQIMMGQLQLVGLPLSEGGGRVVNYDQWDGYLAERDRFFAFLRAEAVDNVVVLTGDIHTSWAIELTEDPNNPDTYDPLTGRGSIGVEFVTPAVTSLRFAGAQ